MAGVRAAARKRRRREPPPGRVPATFLVAQVDGELVGRVSIRHELVRLPDRLRRSHRLWRPPAPPPAGIRHRDAAPGTGHRARRGRRPDPPHMRRRQHGVDRHHREGRRDPRRREDARPTARGSGATGWPERHPGSRSTACRFGSTSAASPRIATCVDSCAISARNSTRCAGNGGSACAPGVECPSCRATGPGLHGRRDDGHGRRAQRTSTRTRVTHRVGDHRSGGRAGMAAGHSVPGARSIRMARPARHHAHREPGVAPAGRPRSRRQRGRRLAARRRRRRGEGAERRAAGRRGRLAGAGRHLQPGHRRGRRRRARRRPARGSRSTRAATPSRSGSDSTARASSSRPPSAPPAAPGEPR